MNRILTVTRLHLNKWQNIVTTPLYILAVVWVVSAVIQLAILRATGADPTYPGYIEGAQWNQGVIWSLPGFLVYYGVQAVSTTYPFGLALGFTRRDFIIGTMLSNMLSAAYISVLLLILLWLELVTGHWGFGMYMLDVIPLGSGNAGILAATAFLGVLFCLTIGGLFGAVWVRFGNKGPATLGLALGLALALLVLLLAPQLGEIAANFSRSWLAIAAGIAIVVSLAGTWVAMRRASVR